MKVLVALALNLTWCAFAVSQCVVILDSKPSSRNAKITVLVDGTPQGNAKLFINLPAGQGSRSLATDLRGAAVLKDLPVGTNCITAAESNLSGGLCLEVSAQSNTQSSFRVSLVAKPPHLNPPEGRVKHMEQSPPTFRLKTLAGVVLDPAGGAIPKAGVQIYKRGSYPREPVMTVKTDDEGKFSASLEPDVYTVIAQSPGFQPEFQSVEISRDGKDDELRQILQLKPTDTCDEAT